jgi:hypothetical protein
MLIWFAALSVLGVYAVFRDPKMDYRFIVVGALLPDAIDAIVWRGIGPFHSVLVGLALLFGVVLATVKRRSTRKRWLAVPIGIFAHQILDAAWANTHAFWWPVAGTRIQGHLPVVDHGLLIGAVLEVVGLIAAFAALRHFGLSVKSRRDRFLQIGELQQRIGNVTKTKSPR